MGFMLGMIEKTPQSGGFLRKNGEIFKALKQQGVPTDILTSELKHRGVFQSGINYTLED